MKVNLWKLKNPAKETIFENCVADVNIPVGEVFTSPVLEGTNGVLHVTRVFLNGLEYKDLEITFENGKIQNYNCANFATEEENRAFIKENILFRHKTLPLGEFAIGTNTTAYVAAKNWVWSPNAHSDRREDGTAFCSGRYLLFPCGRSKSIQSRRQGDRGKRQRGGGAPQCESVQGIF